MPAKASGGNRRLLYLKGIELNARQQIDAVELLSRIPDRIASLVIADPQYRTVLDHLNFGNEGERQKGRAKLAQMSDDTISFLVEESQRILKPSGYMFLWVDKFSVGSGQHLKYLRRAKALQVVDVIVWDKMRIGMGRRARCVTEFMIVIQKIPIKAKGTWTDHGIKDFWSEAGNTARHPHAKPHVLTERLIRAVTKRGDVIIDPCSGGYSTLDACQASNRTFIGGDIA